MSGNEVRIHVRVTDDVDAGFAAVRGKVQKLGGDIEGTLKKTGPKAGAEMGEGLASSLGSTFASLSGNVVPILAGVAVAASPLIGATIAGAVIGGAGIGGVIGGVMLVKDDPRIQSAGKALGTTLMTSLKSDAQVFVGPVLAAIGQIKAGWSSLEPIISGIFKNSSGFVQPLVKGLLAGTQGIAKGIGDLVSRAGPVIGQLSTSFKSIGTAVGTAFTEISQGSKGAVSGLQQITAAIDGTIIATGGLIKFLAQADDGLTKWFNKQKNAGPFGAVTANKPDDSPKVKAAVEQQQKLAAAAAAAAKATADENKHINDMAQASLGAKNGIQSLQEHLDDLTSTAKNLFDATTNVGDAIKSVTDAAKKDGKTLDENTAKGRANRTALSNLADALKAQYDATVAANGVGKKSDAVAATNRSSFIRLATSLGASKKAADQLADSILGIPAKKPVSVDVNTHDAAGRLELVRERLAAIKNKSVSLIVRVTESNGNVHVSGPGGSGTQVKFAHGGIVGAANGAMSSGLTWTGENGPELLDLPPGTGVKSNADSRRMAANAGGGQGDGPVTVNLMLPNGDILAKAVLPGLRNTNRKRHGNSAQAMLAG